MPEINDFRSEYTSEKPSRINKIGSIDGLYIPRIVAGSFLFDKRVVYPSIVQHDGKSKICFFTKKPTDFFDRAYKIYTIKKKKRGTWTYLPIPKYLRPAIIGSSNNPLVIYSFGYSNKSLVIVLERLQ